MGNCSTTDVLGSQTRSAAHAPIRDLDRTLNEIFSPEHRTLKPLNAYNLQYLRKIV